MTAFKMPSFVYTGRTNANASSRPIDASYARYGFIGVACKYGGKLKLHVARGESTCVYDMPNDGTPETYPLTLGSGTYVIRIMRNVGGSSYVPAHVTRVAVNLAKPTFPYLVPNHYCKFDGKSRCVAKARSLCKSVGTEAEALSVICGFVAGHVKYDKDKAKRLSKTKGYVPDPDTILKEGKGICFDYASLTVAMLRSVGIPAKIVTGYVGELYHAWAMAYVDGSWVRRDVTFMASGKENKKEYKDRFVY